MVVLAPPSVTCPSGFRYWCGECWAIDTINRNWFDASANCYALHGYLATVRSSKENRWVYEFLRMYDNAGRDVWIGLNDVSKEGSMVWSDGSTSNFTNFNIGQPDNAGGGEHCAQYWNNKNGAWNDAGCNVAIRSLCRYDRALSAPSIGRLRCSLRWISINECSLIQLCLYCQNSCCATKCKLSCWISVLVWRVLDGGRYVSQLV